MCENGTPEDRALGINVVTTARLEEPSGTGGLSGVVQGRSCEKAETRKQSPAVLLSHRHAEPLSDGISGFLNHRPGSSFLRDPA
jgi:hypothetical protein